MISRRTILIWTAGAVLALAGGITAAYFTKSTLTQMMKEELKPVTLRGKLQEPVFPAELNYLTHCDPSFQPTCRST